ncbi:hypothetical protein L1049_015147 [Liquidambar formosana]|uniref:Cytochrome P450 87A3 n=1 Tax=Liquidambar formosana TaxID=63359 RepID=A0AAP0RXC4_LIQFO
MYKWRNPKCNNGILPPGSMGFPLIGETLQLLIPSYSLDLHPFIKKRIQRYGPVFRTNLVGRPVIVSADPEVNHFILQQEGKSVEFWYLDAFSKLLGLEGESRISAAGRVHSYARGIALSYFGYESLKEKLLPQIEEMVTKTLHTWSSHTSIEVKHAASAMVFNFTARQMFSYDYENSSEKICEKFTNFLGCFLSFPLNIPGTTYHKCLKDQKEIVKMMKDMVKERRASPAAETRQGDLLDHVINDMNTEKFLTEDFIVHMMLALLFASFETTSVVLTLAFKLLAEHPSVLQELTAEHEAILKNRKNMDSSLTWDEYKSMTFTLQVTNELLRLGNIAPGLFRRALKDIQVNGYTIPAGWIIMVVSSALQLNPNTFEDPLAFNPWRWKDLDSNIISKNFMPFGGGMRQCVGADYSKVFMATFFHVLVTKFRWTKIRGGDVYRNPIIGFGDGIHIKVAGKA